jgi:hypothetical protein
MTRPLARLFALIVTLSCAPSTAQVYTTDPLLKARTMYDGNTPIIQSRGLALHDPIGHDDALVPAVNTLRHGSLSYDVTFTFTNSTNSSKPLGRICIGSLTLGEDVTIYDHDQLSTLKELNYDQFTGTGWTYPGTAYSPAMVLMTQTHVVGVSLLYPVMDYKHDALVRLAKLGGVFKGPPESRGWMVAFDLNNVSGTSSYSTIYNPAMLEPGRTQSYTLCIRAMKRPDPFPLKHERQDWIRVLEPYRDYYQSQQNAVVYQRRSEPVYGIEIAHAVTTNAQNPRGWTVPATRPDRLGFAPLVNYHIEHDLGFDNVMVWAPSGLFDENTHYNYPSRFTAGWLDSEKLRTATDQVGFAAIPRSGKQLGLWWGRAAQHMDKWNDDEAEPLDPDNSDHMATVYQQMDLAQQVGATMIGLDAFTHKYMPVWKQKSYIEDLRARYPGISFITEQMSSDVMHAVAPTVNRGYSANGTPREESEYHRLDHPHYLADYINPGHETWAIWRYAEILNADPSQTIDSARLQRDAERLASNGYVAVLQGSQLGLEDHSLARAHETWQFTQPNEDDSQDTDDDVPPDDKGGDNRDSGGNNNTGDDNSPNSNPGNKPGKVYYITLPNGRRLRIESR